MLDILKKIKFLYKFKKIINFVKIKFVFYIILF